MNYSEIIKNLAKKTEQTQTLTRSVIEQTVSHVRARLNTEGKVTIKNFGSFKSHLHAERVMKIPGTGEQKFIPPSYGITFSAGQKVDSLLNK